MDQTQGDRPGRRPSARRSSIRRFRSMGGSLSSGLLRLLVDPSGSAPGWTQIRPSLPPEVGAKSEQHTQGEGTMLEPQGGIFGKALGGELLVSTKLRLTELGAPPPVRPLVEECSRAFGKGLF